MHGKRHEGRPEEMPARGTDGYLRKPIRPQRLDEVLRGYLSGRSEATEARESTLE
jgi:DNA-binding response OmpR family regulator